VILRVRSRAPAPTASEALRARGAPHPRSFSVYTGGQAQRPRGAAVVACWTCSTSIRSVHPTPVSCTLGLVPPRRKAPPPDTAVTYVRVSTEDQAESGLGLESQRSKVLGECERRGWRVLEQYADEGKSGKTIAGRPALLRALDALDRGDAANLVVMKLDRLSRSVHEFTGLVAQSKRQGWSLVVLDIGVDTSTATGDMMVNILASFAQFERMLIGERTSAALQVKIRDGKILGRRQRQPLEVVERICLERALGASLREIASSLNRDEIPTSQRGAKWYASTVAAVLRRPEAQAAIAAGRKAVESAGTEG
jgi:DNA invertase Pin-like site-specific DNA recombinase